MHTHHIELTDDRVNQLAPPLAHELRNMMTTHGRTLVVECEISGAYEKQTRFHPGATPVVDPVAVHLGDHTFDSLAILDDLIDYDALAEEVLREAEEEQKDMEAEAALDALEDRRDRKPGWL